MPYWDLTRKTLLLHLLFLPEEFHPSLQRNENHKPPTQEGATKVCVAITEGNIDEHRHATGHYKKKTKITAKTGPGISSSEKRVSSKNTVPTNRYRG